MPGHHGIPEGDQQRDQTRGQGPDKTRDICWVEEGFLVKFPIPRRGRRTSCLDMILKIFKMEGNMKYLRFDKMFIKIEIKLKQSKIISSSLSTTPGFRTRFQTMVVLFHKIN